MTDQLRAALDRAREATRLRLHNRCDYRDKTDHARDLNADCNSLARWITDDFRAALATSSSQAAGLDVERLANMREVISGWLDAERLLDTMTVDDGPALQDAWDAVHFTREQVAAEYARLAASPDDESGSQDGLDYHPDIVCENCGADSHADEGWRHDCATTQGQPPVTGVDVECAVAALPWDAWADGTPGDVRNKVLGAIRRALRPETPN